MNESYPPPDIPVTAETNLSDFYWRDMERRTLANTRRVREVVSHLLHSHGLTIQEVADAFRPEIRPFFLDQLKAEVLDVVKAEVAAEFARRDALTGAF